MMHLSMFESFDEDQLEFALRSELLGAKYRRELSGESSVQWRHGADAVGRRLFVETGTGRDFEVHVKSMSDGVLTFRYRMVHPFHQPPLDEDVFFPSEADREKCRNPKSKYVKSYCKAIGLMRRADGTYRR